MGNRFVNMLGWLSPYALACGYIHTTDSETHKVQLSLANVELGLYDVKTYHKEAGTTTQGVWQQVTGLANARALYVDLCGGKPDMRYATMEELNMGLPRMIKA